MRGYCEQLVLITTINSATAVRVFSTAGQTTQTAVEYFSYYSLYTVSLDVIKPGAKVRHEIMW